MSTLQKVRLQAPEPHMRKVPNANHRLDEYLLRALNKIKKPSTAEENVLCLYWLGNRPRR